MKKECKSNDWKVKLRAKKKPRFKPGSELADKVNIMNVDINEDSNELHDTTKIDLSIEKQSKERIEIALNKKRSTRFKAGADLTEKVNVMEVELIEEMTENFEASEINMNLKSEENENLKISVKKKNIARFKAGSDLTDKVNLVAVDVIEEIEDEFEVCEITIQIKCNACTLIEGAEELN